MLKVEDVMDIHELHRAGYSVREISRQTGRSRNTVKRVLAGEHSLKRKAVEASSKLDAFKPYLKERYDAPGLSAVRLIEEIRPMGFTGSVDTVRRYLRTLRTETTRKHAPCDRRAVRSARRTPLKTTGGAR
jgi:transposase